MSINISKYKTEIIVALIALGLLVSGGGIGNKMLSDYIEAERAEAVAVERKALKAHQALLKASDGRIRELEGLNEGLEAKVRANTIRMAKLRAKAGSVTPPDNLKELIGWFEDEGITVRVTHHNSN